MALFIRENEMATDKDKKNEVSVGAVQRADDDVKNIQEAIKKVVVLKGGDSNVLSGIDKIKRATTNTVNNDKVLDDSKNADAGPKGPKGP